MRAAQKKAARLDGLAAFFIATGRTKEKTHNEWGHVTGPGLLAAS
jgi:hypothetical protein